MQNRAFWHKRDLTRVGCIVRESSEADLDGMQIPREDTSELDDVDDDSLDRILSMFSAMSAPKPPDVARPIARSGKRVAGISRHEQKTLKKGA